MNYLQKQETILTINGEKIKGFLSGTDASFKFKSENKTFLKTCPDGILESILLNKNSNQFEKDIVTIGKKVIKEYLDITKRQRGQR